MKKLITFVAVLAILLPFSAMAAMTSISDSEMAEVTGQVGISIALVDFNMDMTIGSFTYDDTDVGTIVVSGHDVGYSAGYINIAPINLKNIYVTMNGSPVWAAGTTVTTTMLAQIQSGLIEPDGIAATALEIDVMTAGSTSDTNQFYDVRGKSGVLIGLPDMFISLDGISIDGIYFDNISAYDYMIGTYNEYTEKFSYGTSYPKDSEDSIGSIHIGGITIKTYSSVAGSSITGLGEVRSAWEFNEDGSGNPVRYYPNNRAYLLIMPH